MAEQVHPIGSLTPGVPVTSSLLRLEPQLARKESEKLRANQDQLSISLAAAPEAEQGKSAPSLSPTLEEATRTLQDYLEDLPSDLQFKEDRVTGQLYFKVVNPATQEVIRQVPSEEILAMARKLRALEAGGKNAPGVLLDQRG